MREPDDDDNSPAAKRFREWQERERQKAERRADKERDARDREIDDRISAGMNDREARGVDSCLVTGIALVGAAATIVKGVGQWLKTG